MRTTCTKDQGRGLFPLSLPDEHPDWLAARVVETVDRRRYHSGQIAGRQADGQQPSVVFSALSSGPSPNKASGAYLTTTGCPTAVLGQRCESGVDDPSFSSHTCHHAWADDEKTTARLSTPAIAYHYSTTGLGPHDIDRQCPRNPAAANS